MNLSLYIGFLAATLLLILLPGPTAMLITSKSLRHGVRTGLMAVAGCAVASVLQLLVVVAGLASIITFLNDWFEWVRWIGIAYLVYLGVRAWLDSSGAVAGQAATPTPPSGYHDFGDGFLITLTNPQMLLFLGAFLQQFVDPAFPALPQMLVLAASFLVVAVTMDTLWAVLAARLGEHVAERRSRRLAGRMAGSILIATGVTLALMRWIG